MFIVLIRLGVIDQTAVARLMEAVRPLPKPDRNERELQHQTTSTPSDVPSAASSPHTASYFTPVAITPTPVVMHQPVIVPSAPIGVAIISQPQPLPDTQPQAPKKWNAKAVASSFVNPFPTFEAA